MSVFTTLREANVARQAEWDMGGLIALDYRANELCGEAGEANNVIKKLERERLAIRGSRASVDQLAEELADVVICADLIAMHVGCELMTGTGHPVGQRSASAMGVDLTIKVGRLGACILYFDRGGIGGNCMAVERSARAIAVHYGIDLDAAVRRKFNATSEKVGLRTRMALLESAA